MPGSIIGHDQATRGVWGPYGRAGYLMRGNSPGYTVYSSLPAWISAYALTNVRDTQVVASPSGDPRALDLPASVGGKTGSAWLSIGSTHIWDVDFTADSAATYLVSMFLTNNTPARTQLTTIKSPDGLTTYASATSPITMPGVWCRLLCRGSVKITSDIGSYPMCMGFLIDPYHPHTAGQVASNAVGHLIY